MKKTIRLSVLMLLLPALCPAQSTSSSYLSELEREVVAELNFARQKPADYAKLVAARLQHFNGKLYEPPGEIAVITKEGKKAVQEAVRFLQRARTLPPFQPSRGMSRAASDHVRDQGPKGRLQHEGTDGSQPWDRVNRYGDWRVTVGENIAYGEKSARDIVIGLIVDDGVSNRGHRKNIFNPEFLAVGVAFGPHKKYGTMCVIDFAGGFIERK